MAIFGKKKTIFGIPIGPTDEAKAERSAERQAEAGVAEGIATGPRASAASRGALLDTARQRSAEKLKKRRGGASAATIGFSLGTANIGRATLGA